MSLARKEQARPGNRREAGWAGWLAGQGGRPGRARRAQPGRGGQEHRAACTRSLYALHRASPC